MKESRVIPGLIFICVFCLFNGQSVFSQTTCTKEEAYQTVGKWTKQKVDDLAMADNSFPKEQYKPVLAKAQKVIELLKLANPELIGVDAAAKRMIRGDSYFPNGALKFGINGGFKSYFCFPNSNQYAEERRGKILPSSESGAVINFYFNDFGWALEAIEDQGKFLTANDEALFYAPKKSGDLQGMPVFELKTGSTFGKKEAIFISPNNRLPYKPVSREQFIQSRIKYYREFYRVLERSNFQPIIAELNTMLANMSPSDRQIQAIVSNPFEKGDRLFVTEAKGGKPVVAVDKEFFDAKLPRPAIQFMIVYLDWDEKNPAVFAAMRQFKQNFDLAALKQMLGK